MDKVYDARVVIALKDEFAKAVSANGLQYTDAPELEPLKAVLAEEHATLTSVMSDFEYYVQSSDAHGAEASPMIDWSRDATVSPRAKEYYATKFVVTVGAGTKVFTEEKAAALHEKLQALEGQGAVEMVRTDSMDPAKNPPIPQRYFK